MRADGRLDEQLRPTRITPDYLMHAEGSVLVESGKTKVICTASVEDRVPPFRRNSGKGWVTAEYGMLPRATTTRTQREASQGRVGGRTQEIQRLIGRSLRAVTRMEELGERTITLDCDVIQPDGGARRAAGYRNRSPVGHAPRAAACRGSLRRHNMRTLLVATTIPAKLRVVRPLMADAPMQLIGLSDLPPIEEPEETGATFEGNARL